MESFWRVIGNVGSLVTVGTFLVFFFNRYLFRPKITLMHAESPDPAYHAVLQHADGLLTLAYANMSRRPVKVEFAAALFRPNVLALGGHEHLSVPPEFITAFSLGMNPNMTKEPSVGVISRPQALQSHNGGRGITVNAVWESGHVETEVHVFVRAALDDSALPFPVNMFPAPVTTTKFRVKLLRVVPDSKTPGNAES